MEIEDEYSDFEEAMDGSQDLYDLKYSIAIEFLQMCSENGCTVGDVYNILNMAQQLLKDKTTLRFGFDAYC